MSRTVLSCCAAALAALAVPPVSAAAQEPQDTTVVQELAVDQAQQKAVRDYWTPERIAALEVTPPSDNPPADGPDGGAWNGGGAASKTIGRLFFTYQGEDSSCTATVVDSGNRSVVVTAGHCAVAHDLLGEHPGWVDKSLFVPGFHDGEAPYGTFAARAGVAHTKWVESGENGDYDQSFLVLGPNEKGKKVADAVGATQRIAFDHGQGVAAQEFGYPRAAATDGPHTGRPEFIGRRLARCYGTARTTPDDLWGVPCDMGGGSSGGPRIADFDESAGRGTVVGVNTQGAFLDASGAQCEKGDPDCTRHLVGTHYTASITKALYERAQQL